MKAVALAIVMLVGSSAFGNETPVYLTPPTKNEHVVSKVAVGVFGVAIAASLVLGVVGLYKNRTNAWPSTYATSDTANNLFVSALACDALALASMFHF